MIIKLSNATALKLCLPEGKRQMLYRDSMTKGFGVVVGKETKTFVIRFKTRAGEERQHKIGIVSVITCEDARKEAIRILAEVHKGADPTAALRQARAEGTLKEELGAWFDAHAMKDSTRKTWRSVVNNHLLPALGTRKPSTITKTDILAAYREIQAKSGRQANQAVIILSTFYNRTTDGKFNPASDFRNDKSIRKHRDSEREVFLTQDQVRALLADFDKSPAQQSADVVRLLFYTGARVGEILTLRWDGVNLTQGTLTLDHTSTKEAKSKTLHLSPRAQAIIEKRRDEALEGAEYVFPGRDGEGHQTVVKVFWNAACKRCGIEGVHIHDVRATYSTHLIASGESAKAVGKTMGHADAKTTMRYERIAQSRAKDIANKVDDLF